MSAWLVLTTCPSRRKLTLSLEQRKSYKRIKLNKMATKKEPEYMELTKETKAEKESEVHIYELDIPKVPEPTEPAEDKKDQISLQYHYVKNTDSRGINVGPKVAAPVLTEQPEKERKDQLQYHYVERIDLKRAGPLSNLASQEMRSKIKDSLEEKMKDKILAGQQRQRKYSVKYVAFTVLVLLTVLNTVLASAALAIGGILYSKMGTIQRMAIQNNITSQDFMNS